MIFRIKLLIMTIFYYGSCEDSVTVREPPASPAPPANRIVGGRPTTVETYPYMAYLVIHFDEPDGEQLAGGCGGVILTQHHVLTAAHCLFHEINDTTAVTGTTNLRASEVIVRVGSTYNDRGGSVHVTPKIVVHESYNHPILDNDVAVLVLPTSMSNYRSSSVQPAVIPPGGYVVPNNASVVAVGWGLTDMNCSKSNTLGLRHAGLRKVDRDTCGARWEASVPDNFLCAGLLGVGGAGTCRGDSGGPLVYNGVVVGVTSFGMTCGDSLYPNVFTRVSSYSVWINNTVHQNQVHNSAAAIDANYSLMLLASIWIIYSKN
ncbi:trypsin CFT-1 isoform X1 [Plutella xylostella]|uniref:trypsin CFT-1 isoform X1 n=1 Tax=Plutella xylostella TaxID=51655 RepID=UPI002032AC80|nr:trypsin CFT-1 isoform X1 [Plutella xylostella]